MPTFVHTADWQLGMRRHYRAATPRNLSSRLTTSRATVGGIATSAPAPPLADNGPSSLRP